MHTRLSTGEFTLLPERSCALWTSAVCAHPADILHAGLTSRVKIDRYSY